MAFDNKQVAIEARNMVTEEDPAKIRLTIPHFVAMIPRALEMWTRITLRYPDRRKLFMTEVTTGIAVLGVVDLTDYTNGVTNNVPLDEIRNTVIYDSSGNPMTQVSRYNHLLAGAYDSTYSVCFLDGYNLRIRNSADGALNSYITAVSFTVPDYPITVDNIPELLQGDFIAFLAHLEMGKISRGEIEGVADGSS